ncbi:MAG: type III-B CRISPR module RAMP protein Cmr1 [Methanosarcinaceae archaeon]|nr:type III-B CRISPR module RAMP protein Cmr1 [Methanosarcinaceae archaeon]
MARRTNLPEDFIVPGICQKDNSLITETRKYRMITPLFGGGVKAGVNDPITPIRGTSVRGQLRFWWRACKGGQFSSVEEMKKREDQIWGSAADADLGKNDRSVLPVSLFVRVTSPGRKSLRDYSDQKDVLSFAGFPLRGEKKSPSKKVTEGITFDLSLTYATEFENDVHAALWAWETFGGIGARTRRGFGQLECREVLIEDEVRKDMISSNMSTDSLNKSMKKYCSGKGEKTISKIPLIPDDFNDTNCVFVGNDPNAVFVWESMIRYLKNFRHQTDKTYGANKWPEADSIKELENRKSSDLEFKKFPRAAFGLPIIFKFMDTDHHVPGESYTLIYEKGIDGKNDKERFGSPLFMSVVKTEKGYSGLIVIMNNCRLPPNQPLFLTSAGSKDSGYSVSHKLSEEQAEKLTVSKRYNIQQPFLKGENGIETDVLKAFIYYVKNEEKKGVNKV